MYQINRQTVGQDLPVAVLVIRGSFGASRNVEYRIAVLDEDTLARCCAAPI